MSANYNHGYDMYQSPFAIDIDHRSSINNGSPWSLLDTGLNPVEPDGERSTPGWPEDASMKM